MLVSEYQGYSGLIDWLKRKTGIGYSPVLRLPNIPDNEARLKELVAILEGRNIESYYECEDNECILYVNDDQIPEAIRIINEYQNTNLPTTGQVQQTVNKNLLIGAALTIPLIMLLMKR